VPPSESVCEISAQQ